MTFLLALASTLAADQLSKALIRVYLPEGEYARVLGNFLRISQEHNTGISFSLFTGGSNLLKIALTLLLVALLTVFAFRGSVDDRLAQAGLGLVCGGALGNIVDRLAFSHVIDFIDFSFWPVFNLADTAIVVGVGIFLVSVLRTSAGSERGEGGGGHAP